jgi:ATP-dependent helicase HrpB
MTVEEYPVLEIISELKQKLVSSPLVIVQAPPGAGKSTIIPLQLMTESWLSEKKIIMLEPRRLAARAVAERMSDLIGDKTGGRVGYRVRFDTKVSRDTKVEVVTEGILTRMIQQDNALDEYGLIIFDEFHERSLHADLALSLTLQVQQVLRNDLRILVMSATLDTASLSKLLGDAPVITSKGKQFPVNIRYASQETDQPLPFKVANAVRKACNEESGDILVFLPGAGEIRRVEELLSEQNIPGFVYPLYGDLSFVKQQEAILARRDGQRKIVLATSIAETSLTIEGVRVVIDGGLSRVPRYDPRSGLTRLETVRVTKDSADQRAGRAGRLGPGVCYRLWTQGAQLTMVEHRKPEILEADLAPLMLELFQWGIRDVNELTWITPPPVGAVKQSIDLLRNLDAIDEKGITTRGKKMLLLPTHPRIAHMILIAEEESPKALSVSTDLASLLEERDPVDKAAGADIGIRIEALRKWRAKQTFYADRNALERIEKLAANWRRIVRVDLDNAIPEDRLCGKLLWAAYPERVAQQQGKHSNRYKLVSGKIVTIAQHDPLIREPWLCAAQLDAGNKEGKIFLAAPLHLEDIIEFATESNSTRWDNDREMIVNMRERRIGPLVLESKPHSGKISGEDRIRILSERVRETELRIVGDPEARQSMQSRITSLHHWRKNESWPDMTDQFLLEQVEGWLGPFLSDITKQQELLKLDVAEILKSSLPWELQQRLDVLAPMRIQVPSGSMIKVDYSMHGEPPVMEVRLQEMFGLGDTPTVNEGRTKVKLHLLSPGFKPVQVTQDLRSFWETTYHEVRKELRIRYPRHHWPEDPWTAEAVRGAKRRTNN